MSRSAIVVLSIVWSVVVSGCSTRLNVESEYEVPLGGKLHEIEPIKKDQTVKVAVVATGGPVGVFVYLKKDEETAEKEIFANKYSSIILAKEPKAERADLEASIPANQTAVVHVIRASNKGPTVKVKISN
jgi:hypothetical protein